MPSLGSLKFLAPLLMAALVGACTPGLLPPGPGLDPGGPEAGFQDTVLLTGDGLALPYESWLPEGENGAKPKAVILALHGFNDYSNAFVEAGEFWASQGIATYAYDQRGFGAAPHTGSWPGEEAIIDDLATAISSLRARHLDVPLFLLGESMGGAVILTAAARDMLPPIEGAILAAPAVWGRETMPWYQRWALWLGAHTVPWAEVSGRGLRIQASDNIEMLRGLGRDPLVIKETRIGAVYGLVNLMDAALVAAPEIELQALVLYGARDEVVPKAPILRFWHDLPEDQRDRQRLVVYENGWHLLLRDLEAEVVLSDIASWVVNPNAPLPSGADHQALEALEREDSPGNGQS